MALELAIVSEHADIVGDDAVREFSEGGGTIGRSLQNDWILPDPDRYISARHATIDFKGGMYYLLDTSSNGVYVNDEMEPIGKGNPRRLFDGDRLRMGDFLMTVSIDSGESLIMPMEPEATAIPDNIEQRVDEVSLRTGMKLLDEDEITGDDEFQSVLFGSGSKPAVSKPETGNKPQPPADKKTSGSGRLQVTAEDLFDSFLDGLGIGRAELDPSMSRPEMMLTAGRLLRECISGMTNMLEGRSNLKNTFRLDQTIVLPRHNNPMKLSANTNDLLKRLLVGSEGDYLDAEDSVREVCRDLINHQDAFLNAMNSAFIEFADRFDPDELEESFDRSATGNKLLSMLAGKKYWQMYRDLYPILTEKGDGRFPQMFGEEFVKAYEGQLGEYQRHDRDGTANSGSSEAANATFDPGLTITQRLDAPVEVEVEVESAFEDGEVLDAMTKSGALEIDQDFLDDLDNTLTEEISQDQLKA